MTQFGEKSARLVRLWKDAGERRLVQLLASMMASAIPPHWITSNTTLVPIPASVQAKRRRGFDHIGELCKELGHITNLSVIPLFKPPQAHDQRGLTKAQRFNNMKERFTVVAGATVPSQIILIDDVFTTGATLFNASAKAKSAGCSDVRCLTFARV